MKAEQTISVGANEAVARGAHAQNEVIAIYPITPALPMGEWVDTWSVTGKVNFWGNTPQVIELQQSEGGAAGMVHGVLQAGALTTTFTASQGLLLMMPNLIKIAGEPNPAVFHVAARSIATYALSIFGDHIDGMVVLRTCVVMLASSSVQEAMDMGLFAQTVSLESSIHYIHFFDGVRTSHEIQKNTEYNFVFLATGTENEVALTFRNTYCTDLLFILLFEELNEKNENFYYLRVISREDPQPESTKSYVQFTLIDQKELLLPILQKENTLVYVCRLKGMETSIFHMLGLMGLLDYIRIEDELRIINPMDRSHEQLKTIKEGERMSLKVECRKYLLKGSQLRENRHRNYWL